MLPLVGTVSRRCHWPGVVDPAGVEEHGVHTVGFPRNLRDLISFVRIEIRLEGCAEPQTPGLRSALRIGWSEATQGSERSLERTQ